MFFIILFPIKHVIAELQFGTEDSIQQFIIKLLNKAIQNTCKNISHKSTYVAICRLNLPICSTFLLIIVVCNCLHPSFSTPAAVTFYCLPQPLCCAVAQLQQLHIKMPASFCWVPKENEGTAIVHVYSFTVAIGCYVLSQFSEKWRQKYKSVILDCDEAHCGCETGQQSFSSVTRHIQIMSHENATENYRQGKQ